MTVIITGANGNLGKAAVKKFLDEGHTVIAIVSQKDHTTSDNKQLVYLAVDLSNENDTAAMVKDIIAQHGKIDAALMIAGGFAAGAIADTSGENLRQQISLNFETAYYLTRPLVEHMKQNGYGRLVYIGSRPAITPAQGKNMVAYSLSKSLLFRLAEFINDENKGKNITASVVVPSTIDTPSNRKSMPDANPGNWVKPEQLADILAFICGEKGMPLRESVYKVYNNS